jgi:hypothetical protein
MPANVTPRPARWRIWIGQLRRSQARVGSVLALFLLVPASPAAASPERLCAAQIAAVEAVQARIRVHNAKPHVFQVPRQAAAAAAYGAEAAALDAEQAAAIAQAQACIEAMTALEDAGGSSVGLEPPSATDRARIDEAIQRIPPDWKPLPSPAPGQNWRVPRNSPVRPLFDALRRGNPGDVGNVRIRGVPRPSIGATDPAYPAGAGRVFAGPNARGQSKASPDHIIPLAEIINMPGFIRLNAVNMYAVSRAPLNYQWLSWTSNTSKQSHSVAGMSGVDPSWQAVQVRLENEVRRQLQDLINKLLKSQGAK